MQWRGPKSVIGDKSRLHSLIPEKVNGRLQSCDIAAPLVRFNQLFMRVCVMANAASAYPQASTICRSQWHDHWRWRRIPLDSRVPAEFRQSTVDSGAHI